MNDATNEDANALPVHAAVGRVVSEMFEEDSRSQASFAAAARISTRTFQRILGGGSCTVATLVGVARELGVDPVVILVRAELSAETLDLVSAVSQATGLNAKQRWTLINVIREFREGTKADP